MGRLYTVGMFACAARVVPSLHSMLAHLCHCAFSFYSFSFCSFIRLSFFPFFLSFPVSFFPFLSFYFLFSFFICFPMITRLRRGMDIENALPNKTWLPVINFTSINKPDPTAIEGHVTSTTTNPVVRRQERWPIREVDLFAAVCELCVWVFVIVSKGGSVSWRHIHIPLTVPTVL